MKIPAKIRTYCPKCLKHTIHTVSLYSHGKSRTLAIGNRKYARKKKGYGGQPRPIQRKKAKVTKKQMIKLKCTECGRIVQREGIRIKRLEIVR
ncbi:50S ribosomal protein L44e [archaeon]|nr:MAG: 50S ribosomal protein L44e [archaeon]RLG65688.1 MAG: 50S ribosomal protein L44e [archaeon]HDM23567.1 50S ribosomal protein L44e [Candidatus Bathyarchaeota archaeon]